MQTLDIGETAVIHTEWSDPAGANGEPSAITLTIHPPVGADIIKTKTDFTQGDDIWQWVYPLVVSGEGVWRYDLAGTVAGAAVVLPSGLFIVGPTGEGGPCEPWTTWEEVEACGATDFTTLTVAQRESFIDTASAILFDLSGRRYRGICVHTRDLCTRCRSCWPNVCDCEPYDSIDLGANTHAVWDVVVDGATLTTDDYTLVGNRYLARANDLTWPRGTSFLNPGDFRATWAQGRRAPIGGRKSAALFAAEMAKACLGQACQFPQRVSTVTREGVTFTVIDAMRMVEEGRTGLYLVDLWLVADKRGRAGRPNLFAPGAHATGSMR